MSENFDKAHALFAQEDFPTRKKRARAIMRELRKEFPTLETALLHRNPFELLIATILSAQSTDEQVNKATPALFASYPDAPSLAAAPASHVEELIHSTGFYKNKAKSIQACARKLVDEYNGVVPSSMETLTELPGVGRKTANVVLGNAFGIPGLPVDTHVIRLSNRLALTTSDKPEQIEHELCAMIPAKDWTDASHLLIFFGRKICNARKPKCDECRLEARCPSSRLRD